MSKIFPTRTLSEQHWYCAYDKMKKDDANSQLAGKFVSVSNDRWDYYLVKTEKQIYRVTLLNDKFVTSEIHKHD